MQITIREGVREDVPQVLEMIKELAEYEKAPHEVEVNEQILLEDGFENKFFRLLIADTGEETAGMALYYFGYSTWKGKMLYLDDLIVREKFRRCGIGKKIFDYLINIAKEEGAKQVRWHVLDWNEPAIQFYKKINSHLDPQWITCKMGKEAIENYKK